MPFIFYKNRIFRMEYVCLCNTKLEVIRRKGNNHFGFTLDKARFVNKIDVWGAEGLFNTLVVTLILSLFEPLCVIIFSRDNNEKVDTESINWFLFCVLGLWNKVKKKVRIFLFLLNNLFTKKWKFNKIFFLSRSVMFYGIFTVLRQPNAQN